ncbi:hypothetical protein OsI_33268 [Oryza sativa Indica Group]|uniref:NBS-LRR-like resistance protein n=1 Tax=Oryza sativa subsp. indica TaxID=39946 RepID=A2Z6I8_ORYSI|nr:hypothetical protein OsI_33268 [Oryza sativa Indica Group]
METAVLSAVLRTLGPKLYAFLRDGHDLLRRDLERDVHYIRNELAMIAAAIEEHDRRPPPAAGDVRSAWIRGVRDLACDMEDCVDRFVHRATGHGLASMGARAKFAAVIQELRRKSEELSRLRASYAAAAGEPSCWVATGSSALTLPASSSEAHTLASNIVGMDGPRDEILELIGETQGQLKVISIIGFGGLGKTLLARQIYESDAVAAQFHPRIWPNSCKADVSSSLWDAQSCATTWQPPGHVIKACLLYLGIFPSGHPVRRKTLIRRWSAEGFVGADHHRSSLDVAIDSFEELVNRSIIQPVDVSSNTEVKTCQTHGMMLEFILHKSICDNFITFLYGQARLPDKIRCVSIQQNSGSKTRVDSDIDLSLVRSLTIFGKAHKSFLNFSRYKLLRVLDLEECDELEDEHLKKICKRLLLKYLSLGRGITVLPKEIAKLKFLETLDLRRTVIKFLPIQVLELPCLIHLFGVFKLQDADQQMRKLKSFLTEKSKLETLAGFVTDRCQTFPQLMKHMTNLAKVKIWCENTADASSSSNSDVHLSEAIQEFIQRGTDVNDVRSLSLDVGECSQEFLNFSLGDSCYLSSLKLKGNKICRLPPFVTSLAVLTDLCLSSSDRLSSDVLAALSNVRALRYLKLIARHLDRFVIERGDLQSLRRLHIVVVSMTTMSKQQPEIQEGALPNLESFHLLCKDLDGPCGHGGIRIDSLGLGCLREIVLDDGVRETAKEQWKDAARRHPKRPKVVFVGAGDVVDRRRVGAAAAAAPAAGESNSAMAPAAVASVVAAGDVKRPAREESDISAALASLPAKMARLLGAASIHQSSGTQGELSCGGNGASQRHFS